MPTSTRRILTSLIIAMAVALSGLSALPPAARAAGSNTALVIDSDPGDWVGGGQQLAFVPPGSTFNIFGTGFGSAVSLHVIGPGPADFWNLSIAPAGTAPMGPGTYENAQRFADETHPGLDVSGQGHGCNMTTGRFVVSEIERDSNGLVTTLALSFEQHCEGGPAALFGEVRYQSSTGYKTLTVTPASIDFGSVGTGMAGPDRTVHLTSTGTAGVTLSGLPIIGADAFDFGIVSETCPDVLAPAATCDVVVRATPNAPGARTASLKIGNDTARGLHSVGLLVTGVTPVSAVAWGATRSLPGYSWNLGQSLTRSVNGATTYLHATYTTDRVAGAWVDDNGPYAGVNYVRTTNGGATFTTPKRLNPSTQHGSRGSVASSGKYVYATWISTRRWLAYRGSAPRVLYIRRNSNHGARTSWGGITRLTSLTGRVDYPTVAAAGANVFVAYTDSGTGSVRLKISRDRAASWKTISLGSTLAGSTTAGRYGMPRIAVSGNTVVVAWLADNEGTVRARVSMDAGQTWSATGALTGTSTDIPAVAASGTRVAVAWTDGAGVIVRTWSAGAWSAPRATGSSDGATYSHSYGAAIALNGIAGIGVAWTECPTTCDTWTSSTRANLVWSESRDDGATWFAAQIIGSSLASSTRRYNDYPSILWPSATVRNVIWNAGTAGTSNYRIVMRTGTGVVASTATVTAGIPSQPVEDGHRGTSTTRLRASDGP